KQPTGQTQGQPMSKNNARLAAMNTKAFVKFCNSNQTNSVVNEENDGATVSETTFSSYHEWMDYINNKNQPNNDGVTDDTRLQFMERPLRNWIVNLTATAEPCNRLVHTSAHCLDYLTQEHKYLVPGSPSHASLTSNDKDGSLSSVPMDFHIFWRGPITDKLSLSSYSLLFTQPLDRARLHLWIDSTDLPDGLPENYTQSEFAAPLVSEPLNRFITIHPWDQAAELAYAYGNQQTEEEDPLAKGLKSSKHVEPVAFSDEARFLILNRYGGIYLDADVLLLKDMSPFYDAGVEFAYEWSVTEMYNTAVLRLFPGSSVARRILDGARAREADDLKMHTAQEKYASIAHGEDATDEPRTYTRRQVPNPGKMRPEEVYYHPARLREYLSPQDGKIEGNGLIMMPSAFFDPLWLRRDKVEGKDKGYTDPELMIEDLRIFVDVFLDVGAVCPAQSQSSNDGQRLEDFSAGPEVFMTGAYAYHWHNNWLIPSDPKSWMGLMRKAYDDFVEGRRPNLYGEWFSDILCTAVDQ
ncbi:hypothetical protein BGZ58_002317, partial [Dissophora ornata]